MIENQSNEHEKLLDIVEEALEYLDKQIEMAETLLSDVRSKKFIGDDENLIMERLNLLNKTKDVFNSYKNFVD